MGMGPTGGEGSHRYHFSSGAQKRTTGGRYRWGGTGGEVPVGRYQWGGTGGEGLHRWGRVTPVGEHMKITIYLRKIRYRWDLSSSPTGGEKEPAILYFSQMIHCKIDDTATVSVGRFVFYHSSLNLARLSWGFLPFHSLL